MANDNRLFWACFIVVFTLLAVGFIRSSVSFTSMAVREGEPDILILDKTGFSPSEIVINPGDKVIWRNDMSRVAVLWSPSVDASFTSPVLYTGETYSYVYKNPGTFKFVDVNWGWKGTVIVRQSVVEMEEQSPATPLPETAPACASCASGCSQNPNDCSKCTCSCYSDSDCNDNDDCTIDICSSEPVGCAHRQKAGCAYGLECSTEGQTAIVDGKEAKCTGKAWIKTSGTIPSKGNPILLILGGAAIVAAAVYFMLGMKKAVKPQRKRAH